MESRIAEINFRRVLPDSEDRDRVRRFMFVCFYNLLPLNDIKKALIELTKETILVGLEVKLHLPLLYSSFFWPEKAEGIIFFRQELVRSLAGEQLVAACEVKS